MTSPGPRTTPPTPALEVFTPGARPRALTPVQACCTARSYLGKTSVPVSIHPWLHHSLSRCGFSLVQETPSRAELHSARPTITVPWPTHVSFEAGALEGTLQWPVPRILYPFSLLFWESRLGNKLIRGASLHASLLSPLARYNSQLLLVCLVRVLETPARAELHLAQSTICTLAHALLLRRRPWERQCSDTAQSRLKKLEHPRCLSPCLSPLTLPLLDPTRS